MYYKSYEIKINKDTINLAKDVHVFYRANKEKRIAAIKSILDSSKDIGRVFLLSDYKMKIEDDSMQFNIDEADLNYNVSFLVHDMERTYDLMMCGKQKFRTFDEFIDALDSNFLPKYTLLIIDNAKKYIKNDVLTKVLRLLQKGRAAGFHVILLDDIFINNLTILANTPCKIAEKEEKQNGQQ